ncbi:zinc-ribbon domain-containing protein [Paraburkholderia saeva]|uniref:zinc-ribbon domain-containing protein n=1 Tax=Paraburkholderia saeva TaxID=2777537 RepID=UPI001DB98FF9|nr:zinc ribbon domain-containing protein [Paraburkholderia saeva]CAG4924593.1 hypothetical protein R52603_05281 [Paraburkholderia saeva]
MALVKCTDCGRKISTEAKACPNCGAPPQLVAPITDSMVPKRKKRRIWPWVLGGVILLPLLFKKPPPQQSTQTQASSNSTPQATARQTATPTSSEDDDETKQMVWMERVKDAVKARLKDPDSAMFKNVFFSRGKDNIPMTCGQVNSKNSFGGFVGFQRFISGGSSDLTFLETEVSDFHKSWQRFCSSR